MNHPLPDPYEELAERLRVAAASSAQKKTARRLPRLPRSPFAIAILTIGVVGTASAAAVVVASGPSKDTHGSVRIAAAGAMSHYQLSVAPSVGVGQPGWCIGVAFRDATTDQKQTSALGCQPDSRDGRHTYGSGLVPGPGGSLAYGLFDSSVAAVRLSSGRMVRTATDPSIPGGYRFVIVGLSDAESKSMASEASMWTLIGSSGATLLEPADSRSAPIESQPVRLEQGPARGSDVCDLVLPASAPSITETRVLVGNPRPEGLPSGLLSCLTSTISAKSGGDIHASVLLDAAAPTTQDPPTLPGAEPAGQPGVWNVPRSFVASTAAEAERLPHSWLVVEGGSADEREAILAGARVSLHGA